MTDDLLWLAFVSFNYLKETADFSILEDRAPYLDVEGEGSIAEHIDRAFERAFSRFSFRGLPLIGAGDWNDGLSAVGLRERGESIWLAHFLVGLLADWGGGADDDRRPDRRRARGGTSSELGRRRERARLGWRLVSTRVSTPAAGSAAEQTLTARSTSMHRPGRF